MKAVQERLPDIAVPLQLPELTVDEDVLLPGSLAYAGFRFNDQQGEVFGDFGGRHCGIEIVVHFTNQSIGINHEDVRLYQMQHGEEALERLIMDALAGRIGEEA